MLDGLCALRCRTRGDIAASIHAIVLGFLACGVFALCGIRVAVVVIGGIVVVVAMIVVVVAMAVVVVVVVVVRMRMRMRMRLRMIGG